jgi:DinB superfamily
MQFVQMTGVERDVLMASLARMVPFLRETLGSLTADEARIPGPEGAFSPVEHVWHLADLEREGFGLRIQRLQAEIEPHLPDFDGPKIARERNYRVRSLAAGLEAFELARAANLAALRSLGSDSWKRSGTQEGAGPVSLSDIPGFMQQHDRSHVAEIREWQRHQRDLGRRERG